MDYDKIFYPEVIANYPIPESSEPTTSSAGSSSSSTTAPKTELDVKFPVKNIASDVQSASFDTKTRQIKGAYKFGELGSIQLGGILLDGLNNRIVLNDGTNDRVVIGEV